MSSLVFFGSTSTVNSWLEHTNSERRCITIVLRSIAIVSILSIKAHGRFKMTLLSLRWITNKFTGNHTSDAIRIDLISSQIYRWIVIVVWLNFLSAAHSSSSSIVMNLSWFTFLFELTKVLFSDGILVWSGRSLLQQLLFWCISLTKCIQKSLFILSARF